MKILLMLIAVTVYLIVTRDVEDTDESLASVPVMCYHHDGRLRSK